MVFFIFIFFAFAYTLCSANERGIEVDEGTEAVGLAIGKQYAVLIGISKYRHWLPLQYPVPDIKKIEGILNSRYLFDTIIELYDETATKANIIRTFEMLQKKLEPNDSLLILYSGHGYYDTKTNTGFWIPIDAGRDVYKQENWLPNTQIRGLISNIDAIHVLLLVDSCFSGDIIEGTRDLTDVNEYFVKAYNRVSRLVITSGGSETVSDKSEFAENLKYILRQNKKSYIDALTMFYEIRDNMQETMPIFGGLNDTGHQNGSCFLIFLKQEKEQGKSIEIMKRPDVKSGQKSKSLLFGISTAFTYPFLYNNEENILAPYGGGEIFMTWKAGEVSSVQFSIGLSCSYRYHPNRDNSDYENDLQLINSCFGVVISLDFPFYKILGMDFSLLAGPAFIVVNNKFYDDTSFYIKPSVIGNIGFHYTITDNLMIQLNSQFTTIIDNEDITDWYKGIGIGAGIGYRF
ncbi:MAG: caspase family protein [Spirochaetales bacterium]|nr:caspase family protein [Spirochaetales bacterium]